jgi:alcohol dehydrogenase class IV
MIPVAAVLDPENTRTLPPYLTATTGMDALTHAVEAYIGRSTTRKSRKNALDSIKLVSENLLKCYENGDDMDARRNMLLASFYGGAAFSVSYVGYCHAVAHSLGGKYNIPHGLANAVLLPKTLEIYGKSAHKKLKDVAVAFGVATEQTDEKTAAENFINAVYDYNKKMGISETFPEIRKEDIAALSKLAAKEANPIYPVPRLMNATEIQEFYFSVCENK